MPQSDVPLSNTVRVVFFDIDGVLADCSHRLSFQREKDYDKFYSEDVMMKDSLNLTGIRLLRAFEWGGYFIVFVTGRPERTRDYTKRWLSKEGDVYFSRFPLLMRKDGDHRPSDIVKQELVAEFEPFGVGAKGEAIVAFFVDDDPKNCKAMNGKMFYGSPIISLLFGTERL